MSERSTVHVSGFPAGTRANELAPQFESVGRLVRIDIPPLGRFKSVPYAFVEYESSEDAENAIRSCDGTPFELNKSYSLRVQFARSKPRREGEFGDRGRDPRESRDPRGYRDPRERDPRDYRDSRDSRDARDPRDRMRSYRDQDDRRGGPGQGPRSYDDRRGGNSRPYGTSRFSGNVQPPRRYDERLGEPKPYEPVLGTPVPVERKLRDPPAPVNEPTQPEQVPQQVPQQAQELEHAETEGQTHQQEPAQLQQQVEAEGKQAEAGNESDGSNYDPQENTQVPETTKPDSMDVSEPADNPPQEQEQETKPPSIPTDPVNQTEEGASKQVDNEV